MSWRESRSGVDLRVRHALALGPYDPITGFAFWSNTVIRLPLLVPLALVTPFSSAGLGCGVAITFGLLLLPFNAIWMVLLALLLGTSRLWIAVPILRPLLFPLVVLPVAAFAFVSLVPDMGERNQKLVKMGLCESWPVTQHFWDLSMESPDFPEESL